MVRPTTTVTIFAVLLLVWECRVVGAAGVGSSFDGSEDPPFRKHTVNDDDGSAAAPPVFLEPEVHRFTNIVPRSVCEEIIRLGEENGFPMEGDSIDDCDPDNEEGVVCLPNNNSQAIDVMSEEGEIIAPEIFAALEPYIPKMVDLIRQTRNETLDKMIFPDAPPNRAPNLGWVFYRKYSPDSPRNSLVPHLDTNLFTVNIALNDDYTGGGVFYIKPTIANNQEYIDAVSNGDSDREIDLEFNTPALEPHQHTYEWVDALKENSSDIVFPEMRTGDAMLYNYTVYHAVAPIEKGTRYSMVLFFDMDNPMLPENNEEDDENDGDDDEVEFRWRHSIWDCDPYTKESTPIEDAIDIYWMIDEYEHDDDNHEYDLSNMELIKKGLQPGELDPPFDDDDEQMLYAEPGFTYRAYRSVPEGSPPTELLATLVIEEGVDQYDFVSPTQHFCDDREEDREQVQEDIAGEDEDDDDEDEDDPYSGNNWVPERFEHGIKECDPSTGRLVPIEDAIDIYYVDDDELELTTRGLPPGEVYQSDEYFATAGHEYRAFRSVVVVVVPSDDGRHRPDGEWLATLVIEAGDDEEGDGGFVFEGAFKTQEDCDERSAADHRVGADIERGSQQQ